MYTHCPETYISLANKLADIAASLTLSYFRQTVAVESKADTSPVTIADRQAEEAMVKEIEAHHPGHGIYGEEFGQKNTSSDYTWMLDPIDGTKSFITGNPLFGTLIALLHDGKPILGIIDMPALGERFVGARGYLTRLHDKAGEKQISCASPTRLGEATLRTTSPYMYEGADKKGFDALAQRVKFTTFGGDCYGAGQLASGFSDIYIEAMLKPYDYMAMIPVIEGAGGVIRDWAGAPLDVNSDGRILAAGNTNLFKDALRALQAQ